MCSAQRKGGSLVFWTETELPWKVGDMKKNVETLHTSFDKITGTLLFAVYNTEDRSVKLCIAWSSERSYTEGAGQCMQAMKISQEDWIGKTQTFQGKLFTTNPDVRHVAEPGLGQQMATRVLGLGVYHCHPDQLQSFEDAFHDKNEELMKIPGKSYYGYYYHQARPDKPMVFTFWDTMQAVDQGKGALWTIMMDQKSGAAPSKISVHASVPGGLFTKDSDRSYHPCELGAGQ